jgi:hypothetical protein
MAAHGTSLLPKTYVRKKQFFGAIVLHARAITSTNHRQPAGQPAACNLNLRSHDSTAEFSRSVLLFISYCALIAAALIAAAAAGARRGREAPRDREAR